MQKTSHALVSRLVLTLAVTYAGVLGGAERTLLDFTRALPGGLVLACPDGPLADRARAEGVKVLPLPSRPLELRGGTAERLSAGRALAGHTRDVRRLVREAGPDLLVAWGMRTAIAAPAAVAGLDPRPAVLVRHVDFLPGPTIARLVRAAAARADRVSVNSEAVGRDLDPDGRLGDRLSVISPGIDLSDYDRDWGMAPEPEVLLLGTLMPWKRPDLALEVVARAAKQIPQLRLTVAGAPMNAEGESLLARLRARATQPDLDGRVDFAGQLADPRHALSRAWCLLHCADREPFGNVLLQALASGRPVVAPAAGGARRDRRGDLRPPLPARGRRRRGRGARRAAVEPRAGGGAGVGGPRAGGLVRGRRGSQPVRRAGDRGGRGARGAFSRGRARRRPTAAPAWPW